MRGRPWWERDSSCPRPGPLLLITLHGLLRTPPRWPPRRLSWSPPTGWPLSSISLTFPLLPDFKSMCGRWAQAPVPAVSLQRRHFLPRPSHRPPIPNYLFLAQVRSAGLNICLTASLTCPQALDASEFKQDWGGASLTPTQISPKASRCRKGNHPSPSDASPKGGTLPRFSLFLHPLHPIRQLSPIGSTSKCTPGARFTRPPPRAALLYLGQRS